MAEAEAFQCYANKNYERALDLFRELRADRGASSSNDLAFNEAKILEAMGRHTEALKIYTEILDVERDMAVAYYERAACYLIVGGTNNVDAAIDDYTMALRLFRTHELSIDYRPYGMNYSMPKIDVICNLAIAKCSGGDFQGAQFDLRDAKKLLDNDPASKEREAWIDALEKKAQSKALEGVARKPSERRNTVTATGRPPSMMLGGGVPLPGMGPAGGMMSELGSKLKKRLAVSETPSTFSSSNPRLVTTVDEQDDDIEVVKQRQYGRSRTSSAAAIPDVNALRLGSKSVDKRPSLTPSLQGIEEGSDRKESTDSERPPPIPTLPVDRKKSTGVTIPKDERPPPVPKMSWSDNTVPPPPPPEEEEPPPPPPSALRKPSADEQPPPVPPGAPPQDPPVKETPPSLPGSGSHKVVGGVSPFGGVQPLRSSAAAPPPDDAPPPPPPPPPVDDDDSIVGAPDPEEPPPVPAKAADNASESEMAPKKIIGGVSMFGGAGPGVIPMKPSEARAEARKASVVSNGAPSAQSFGRTASVSSERKQSAGSTTQPSSTDDRKDSVVSTASSGGGGDGMFRSDDSIAAVVNAPRRASELPMIIQQQKAEAEERNRGESQVSTVSGRPAADSVVGPLPGTTSMAVSSAESGHRSSIVSTGESEDSVKQPRKVSLGVPMFGGFNPAGGVNNLRKTSVASTTGPEKAPVSPEKTSSPEPAVTPSFLRKTGGPGNSPENSGETRTPARSTATSTSSTATPTTPWGARIQPKKTPGNTPGQGRVASASVLAEKDPGAHVVKEDDGVAQLDFRHLLKKRSEN